MSALPAAAEKPKVEPDSGNDVKGMGIWLTDKDGKLLDGNRNEGGVNAFYAGLIGLKITTGGQSQKAQAYCVELPTPLEDGRPLEEVPWGEHPNPKFAENAGKINWILQNTFPQRSVEEVAKQFDLPISKKSVLITATQAAIWHFSDGSVLRADDSTQEVDDVDKEVHDLYEYLVAKAQPLEEPKPTLGIDPAERAGKAGERIGPFTVSSTADQVVLTADLPQGVSLVRGDGTPLDLADPNARSAAAAQTITDVWVQVDEGVEPGSVEFSVSASTELRVGRLFISVDKNQATQSLIIADAEKSNVVAKAKASWTEGVVVTTTTAAPTTTTTVEATTTTAAPTTTTTAVASGGGNDDDLANTGASIFVPLLIGVGLLGAGAAALLVVRRKRAA
ncbi:thioester domain-containing protein [Saccharothrix longispora]|uniref:TQXA domain-containing protein/LPXTG-motif cell wall-anchored protein n=1 Tax=Saccharothrix longispora TaxID=33920 RepID=A0ABU1Q3Y6_9PSEU|nr:thioester domain-containing protein [Saccharothrix longispora]MDR6597581.1 TQXA domain-containing protein/LPXTG-motif cell wall-anchored protein [Saccharothrix longispora]